MGNVFLHWFPFPIDGGLPMLGMLSVPYYVVAHGCKASRHLGYTSVLQSDTGKYLELEIPRAES